MPSMPQSLLAPDDPPQPATNVLGVTPPDADWASALGDLYRRVVGNGRPDLVGQQQPFAYADQPVGSESTRQQSVGNQGAPFDPVVAMLPGGTPVLRSDIPGMQAGKQAALATALGITGDAPTGEGLLGIRAYHGSPYSFERFDPAKIGTGEGAQAFGHGLYFAESEGVAKSYRDALAGKGAPLEWNGQPVQPGAPFYDLVDKISDQDWRLGKIVEHAGKFDTASAIDAYEPHTRNASDGPEWQAAMDKFKQGAGPSTTGSMYEVNLQADPEQFLHWDKPRDQLAPNVQDWAKENYPAAWDKAADGASLYQHIVKQVQSEYPGATKGYLPPPGFNAQAQVTQEMAQAGIPGIRYLDQGSRYTADAEHVGTVQGPDGRWRATLRSIGQPNPALPNTAPESVLTKSPPMQTKEAADAWAANKTSGATHNYVVFDPATIAILRKYGIAGLMAGGAGVAAGTQGNQQDQRP